MTQLQQIQQRLKDSATPERLAEYRRIIPTALPVYGVPTPVINDLAKEFGSGGIELADALWASGAYEERLLATKILGRCGRKSPEETWQTALRFLPDLCDWATCDTLGTQGIRGLLPRKGDEIFATALEFCGREEEWTRRFGLVLLTNFVKDPARVPSIESALASVAGDKRHYVRKALEWLRKDLAKTRET